MITTRFAKNFAKKMFSKPFRPWLFVEIVDYISFYSYQNLLKYFVSKITVNIYLFTGITRFNMNYKIKLKQKANSK